jgi:hypothetical protein
VELGPFGTSATQWPIVPALGDCGLVEWRLAGDTEALGETLPQRHFVDHKSHLTDSGWNPDLRGGKPATRRGQVVSYLEEIES